MFGASSHLGPTLTLPPDTKVQSRPRPSNTSRAFQFGTLGKMIGGGPSALQYIPLLVHILTSNCIDLSQKFLYLKKAVVQSKL